MKSLNCPTSTCQHCRLCRNFTPEGRRGGTCQQLGVPVRGSWKACSLAIPAFAPSWEVMEEIAPWQSETPSRPDLGSLKRYAFKNSQLDSPTGNSSSTSAKLTTDLVLA